MFHKVCAFWRAGISCSCPGAVFSGLFPVGAAVPGAPALLCCLSTVCTRGFFSLATPGTALGTPDEAFALSPGRGCSLILRCVCTSGDLSSKAGLMGFGGKDNKGGPGLFGDGKQSRVGLQLMLLLGDVCWFCGFIFS